MMSVEVVEQEFGVGWVEIWKREKRGSRGRKRRKRQKEEARGGKGGRSKRSSDPTKRSNVMPPRALEGTNERESERQVETERQ